MGDHVGADAAPLNKIKTSCITKYALQLRNFTIVWQFAVSTTGLNILEDVEKEREGEGEDGP